MDALCQHTHSIIKQAFQGDEERAVYAALDNRSQITMESLAPEELGKNYVNILSMLLRMRQACNHPQLSAAFQRSLRCRSLFVAFEVRNIDCDFEELADDLDSMPGHFDSDLVTGTRLGLSQKSTKIAMLLEVLRKIRADNPHRKILVFSSFTSMLDAVRPFLEAEDLGTIPCKALYTS